MKIRTYDNGNGKRVALDGLDGVYTLDNARFVLEQFADACGMVTKPKEKKWHKWSVGNCGHVLQSPHKCHDCVHEDKKIEEHPCGKCHKSGRSQSKRCYFRAKSEATR